MRQLSRKPRRRSKIPPGLFGTPERGWVVPPPEGASEGAPCSTGGMDPRRGEQSEGGRPPGGSSLPTRRYRPGRWGAEPGGGDEAKRRRLSAMGLLVKKVTLTYLLTYHKPVRLSPEARPPKKLHPTGTSSSTSAGGRSGTSMEARTSRFPPM